MNFAEQRLEVLARTVANLNAQLSELNELRERIRSDKTRCDKAIREPSKSTPFALALLD
jgi:hypothetical protein